MKRANTSVIIGLLISIFFSCEIDKKEIKSDMKVTLTEDKESKFKRLSFDSKSIEENEITTDIIHVLNRLNKEKLIKKEQLLFLIERSYRCIFITGYNLETKYIFNNNIIKITFQEYDSGLENIVNFDNLIINSIKKALNSDIGKITKESFVVYYKTETGDVQRIK